MNQNRRKQISELKDQLDEIYNVLDAIADEEQEAFDNLPENLQYSQRGEAIEEAARALENSRETLTEVINELEELTD